MYFSSIYDPPPLPTSNSGERTVTCSDVCRGKKIYHGCTCVFLPVKQVFRCFAWNGEGAGAAEFRRDRLFSRVTNLPILLVSLSRSRSSSCPSSRGTILGEERGGRRPTPKYASSLSNLNIRRVVPKGLDGYGEDGGGEDTWGSNR